MNKIASLFFMLQLFACPVIGQQVSLMTERFNAALKEYKVATNEDYRITQLEIIECYNYVTPELLSNTDSMVALAKSKSFNLYRSIQNYLFKTYNLYVGVINFTHVYVDKRFVGYRNSTFVCAVTVRFGEIEKCTPIPRKQFVSNDESNRERDMFENLAGYNLLPNQYFGRDATKGVLFLTTLVEDVHGQDLKKDSKKIYGQFKKSVKNINKFYNQFFIRYADKHKATVMLDFSYPVP